jgi:hypothetical protein
MFRDGLTPLLAETLGVVSNAIPALRPLLQERLLHEVSLLLAGRPFSPPGADPFPLPGEGWAPAAPAAPAAGAGAYAFALSEARDAVLSGAASGYGLVHPSLSEFAGRVTPIVTLSSVLAAGLAVAAAASACSFCALNPSGTAVTFELPLPQAERAG